MVNIKRLIDYLSEIDWVEFEFFYSITDNHVMCYTTGVSHVKKMEVNAHLIQLGIQSIEFDCIEDPLENKVNTDDGFYLIACDGGVEVSEYVDLLKETIKLLRGFGVDIYAVRNKVGTAFKQRVRVNEEDLEIDNVE